jgi:hypothetical protein
MIIEEQFVDIKTGESGRRLVDVPDVITEAQALVKDEAARVLQAELDAFHALRERLIDATLSGDPVSGQDRAEYKRLRLKHMP